MRSYRLNSILGKMYGPGAADGRCKQSLETDLLSRYRKLHPKNRRWLMLLNPWNRIARFVFAGLTMCTIAVAACTSETTTEVDLGKQLHFALDAANENPSVEGRFVFTFIYLSPEDMTREATEMSKLLMSQSGVEDASVWISQQDGGEVTLDIVTWGTGLDTDVLMSTLKTSYPVLADASVTINDLSTKIKESYASKIGRAVLRIEASGIHSEELRQQILEQLVAQDYDGHVDLDIQTDGNQSTKHVDTEEE